MKREKERIKTVNKNQFCYEQLTIRDLIEIWIIGKRYNPLMYAVCDGDRKQVRISKF